MNQARVFPEQFSPGRISITPGARDAIAKSGEDPLSFLGRHVTGDWGDLCDEDKRQNDFSLENGFRLLSAYHTRAGVKLWIITEHDRSTTTILLPSEY
jgi:hypothetical protein